MDLSGLNAVLGRSENLTSETSEFANGLNKLAEHWRGQDGVKEITQRVNANINAGLPVQESLSEAYQYLKGKIF